MLNGLNAANAYSAARSAVQPGAAGQPTALQQIGDAATEFAAQMARVDEVSAGTMTGKADTHQLVQTIAEAELALETVVSIRDKVVEAYQEILRMPV